MASNQKLNRYKNLIKDFKNWYAFFFYKITGGDTFTYKLRNGFDITIERRLNHTFKENFFDKVYLQNLGESYAKLESPVIVDIGAQVGLFSLMALTSKPKAKVFSFEPMPVNFKKLSEFKSHYGDFDWTITQVAVGADNEPLTLYTDTTDLFTSRSSVFGSDDRQKGVEVPTITFDQILEQNAIRKIDLLKFDCEGSEYPIVYSMTKEHFDKIDHICLESHQGSKEGENHKSLVKYISQFGYNIVEQDNHNGTGYIWATR